MRKILCDTCGKEIPSPYVVFARLAFKEKIPYTTKTGKTAYRVVARYADFCCEDCLKKFVPKVKQP